MSETASPDLAARLQGVAIGFILPTGPQVEAAVASLYDRGYLFKVVKRDGRWKVAPS